MRLILVTNSVWPDKIGGLERYFSELAGALAGRGHDVVLLGKRVSTDAPSVERPRDRLTIIRYETASHDDPLFLIKYHASIHRSLRRHLRELRADEVGTVLHAFFPFQGEALRRYGLRYLYTCAAPVHKEIRSEHQSRFLMPSPLVRPAERAVRAIERRAIEGASTVVAISEFTRTEILGFCQPRGRVEVILGGIDTEFFRPVENMTPKGCAESPVLFAARRHVVRTGVENLVAAMALIRRAHPGVRLFLAGDGPRRPVIERLIEELNLSESVFLLGRISDDEVRDWYRKADISVTPTWALEGFGLSTAEAMACGGVPLVTPVGSNPELVMALGAQHITRNATPEGIADGVVNLLGEGSHVGGRSAAHALAQVWDWGVVAERYEKHYLRLAVALPPTRRERKPDAT